MADKRHRRGMMGRYGEAVGWWALWMWGVFVGLPGWGAEERRLPEQPEGERYGILIGIERYRQKELELVFCLNDVEELAKVLKEAGYQICRLTEQEPSESQPTRANLQEALPRLLGRAGPQDTVLVYFTGHGFVGSDGKLYLAPLDCDPADLEHSGLEAEWLREQLARCEARVKLLVLDVCHAGQDKGLTRVAKDVVRPFERTPGLYVIASCRGDQKSLLWETKRQSLFSYWLVQGLRGHADREGKGQIGADDLYRYVSLHVPRVAQRVFHRAQEPDRVVGPAVAADAAIVTTRARSLKALLQEIAEQIATIIQVEGLPVVGVPEFAVDAKKAELELGGNFGLMGRYCATELSGLLAKRSGGQFQMVAQDLIQQTLRKQRIQVAALRRGTLGGLTVESAEQKMPLGALIVGVLRNRVGHRVLIQCEVWGVQTGVLYGTAGGEAELTEDDWKLFGGSVAVRPSDYRPEPGQTPAGGAIAQWDRRLVEPHPMKDPNFPYRVYVVVGQERRPGKFLNNDLYVPLRRGEHYEIHVELKPEVQHQVQMRLLVDGLSTLPEPQKLRRRGLFVEPVSAPIQGQGGPSARQEYVPAQRVSLDEASAWLLDPNSSRVFAVRGFVVEVNKNRYQKFEVVDIAELPSVRREFTDQLGIITAAFYEPVRTRGGQLRRSIATRPGPEGTEIFETYTALEPGKALAILHIRYVDFEQWEQLPGETVRFDQ